MMVIGILSVFILGLVCAGKIREKRKPIAGIGTARITYTDVDGNETQRDIVILGITIKDNSDIQMESFCTKRKAYRTFLASRVSEYIDLKTGEYVTDVRTHLRELAHIEFRAA